MQENTAGEYVIEAHELGDNAAQEEGTSHHVKQIARSVANAASGAATTVATASLSNTIGKDGLGGWAWNRFAKRKERKRQRAIELVAKRMTEDENFAIDVTTAVAKNVVENVINEQDPS